MAWENIATYVGISVVFGLIKSKFRGTQHSVANKIISVGISICVAVIVGFMLESLNIAQGVVLAMVAASALTAESIVLSIIDIGQMFERDPIAAFKKLKDLNNRDSV